MELAARRWIAPTVTTDTILTLAHLMAITAPPGFQAGYSSVLAPGMAGVARGVGAVAAGAGVTVGQDAAGEDMGSLGTGDSLGTAALRAIAGSLMGPGTDSMARLADSTVRTGSAVEVAFTAAAVFMAAVADSTAAEVTVEAATVVGTGNRFAATT